LIFCKFDLITVLLNLDANLGEFVEFVLEDAIEIVIFVHDH